jgi:uncharacterized protein YjbI with pentapeptide repeats
LAISLLTLRSNEKGKLADRFAKAFDHLGAVRSPEETIASEVRIGAVAELEGVGEESPREQRMIRYSFTAYMAQFANRRSAANKSYDPAVWRLKEIQAMLSVLGRWGISRDDTHGLRMTDLDLRNMRLPSRAKLAYVKADRSCFDYAELADVDLRESSLDKASFRGANLRNANFRKAKLTRCDFVGEEARTDVWGWNKPESRFGWNAPSKDADLRGADLRGADLTLARITKKQFDSAVTDDSTKPPGTFYPT